MIVSQEDTNAQVTGSGTSNTIPKWTGSTSLGFYLHPDAFNLPEERSINSRLGQKQ
jgi:hypothetical protein